GKVLVDERSLWPGGRFVTTELVVRTQFLKDHPDVVEHLLEGHLAATEYVNREPADAQKVVNAGIAKITGKALPDAVVAAAWNSMVFTFDPLADTLRKEAGAAQAAVLRSHRWRTAENSAAYLLPRLRPGMRILDVGCGPGTLTADLAARVGPGAVVGIDTSAEVLDEARAYCAEQGVENVTLVHGD